MARARLTVVTQRSYARALGKETVKYYEQLPTNRFLHCPNCRKPCMVGQPIVTKRAKNNTKWYHKECAIALNITWGDSE